MTYTRTIEPDFKTPLDMFYHWEVTRGDKAWLRQAVKGEWRSTTWSEAGDQARRIATGIQNLGLNHGDKVGIFAANSPDWLMADIALMMAGMVTVPIYTTMPLDKVSYVAGHSDMRAVFVDGSIDLESLRPVLPADTRIIALPGANANNTDNSWEEILATAAPIEGNPRRDRNDIWTIVYTSGTTGMPKGVVHSFSTLAHSGAGLPGCTGTTEESRLFSYLPLAHAAERVLVQLQSIYSGAMVGFNGYKDSFAADLQEIRPTFFLAVPRIWTNLKAGIISQLGNEAWQGLLENPQGSSEIGKSVLASMGLDAVTFAFSGAAPISASDIRAWRALGMPLYEGYAQSEIMSGTLNMPDDDCIGSVGKLFPSGGGEMCISDIGEILLRAPGNMVGYYKAPEKTAETIVDGWVRTGDKGRIDENGFLHITGRVKEIFKTAKGKYVAPGPIEKRFETSPHVDQLCLVGSGRPQTLMLVNLTTGSMGVDKHEVAEQLEEQRQAVNEHLEAHERISHVILCAEPWTIENRMLTHTLKILRDDVERKHGETIEKCVEDPNLGNIIWE